MGFSQQQPGDSSGSEYRCLWRESSMEGCTSDGRLPMAELDRKLGTRDGQSVVP